MSLLKRRTRSRAAKTFASMHEHPATQRRRPRIPSLFYTISNNNPPPALRPIGPTPSRGRAYRPTLTPPSTPDLARRQQNRPAHPNPALGEAGGSTPPARRVTHIILAGEQSPTAERGGDASRLRTQLHLGQSGANKNLSNTLPQGQASPRHRQDATGKGLTR